MAFNSAPQALQRVFGMPEAFRASLILIAQV